MGTKVLTEWETVDAKTGDYHVIISYNELAGKRVQPTGRANAAQAVKLVEEGVARFQQKGRDASLASHQ